MLFQTIHSSDQPIIIMTVEHFYSMAMLFYVIIYEDKITK